MFETLSGSRRSRPALTLSLGAHVLFVALLTVPPLLATQEPPEPEEKIPPLVLPVGLGERSEEKPILLRRGRESERQTRRVSSEASAPAPATESAEKKETSVSPPAQPSAVPSTVPAEPGDSAYSPFEEGERSERKGPLGSLEGDGNGAGEGPVGCEGCPQSNGFFSLGAPDVIAPVAIATPEPLYPQAARVGRAQGTVLLRAVIGEDGLVRKVEVLESPSPLLARAASDAVLSWRYRPGRIGSRPVLVYLYVTVRFTLHF